MLVFYFVCIPCIVLKFLSTEKIINCIIYIFSVVRQSANRLETTTTVKRFQFGAANGYKSLVNSQSSSSLAITENPLEAYLDCYSDPKKDEPRVEDEGENAKREKIDVV